MKRQQSEDGEAELDALESEAAFEYERMNRPRTPERWAPADFEYQVPDRSE